MKILALILLTVILSSGCQYIRPEVGLSKNELRSGLSLLGCENENRIYGVIELFLDSGARPRVLEYGETANVIVELPGESSQIVLIGAHFDKTTLGCGAVDNGTGIILLREVYEKLKEKKRRKTYHFVAFGDEEKGLVGSAALAGSMKTKPAAMINLDSFGVDNIWAMESISDRSLIKIAADVERKRGGSFGVRRYSRASSDSKSFRDIGVPAITLSGLDNDWRDYLHKKEDQFEKINTEKVNQNLAFLREFVLALDGMEMDAVKADKAD